MNRLHGFFNRRALFQAAAYPLAVTLGALFFFCLTDAAAAQSGAVEAYVARTTRNPSLIRNARTFALRKGFRLLPGDEIDTTAGGQVVISLTDGSLVTVAAGSRVILKDFRQATGLRELIDVVIGRIRVRINKLGGRPNPYRVNSPTASIAVRGTEFIVRVAASGETTVTVTEGLVEVSSRINQEQKTLVEPGRSVIVRPSGDIGLNLVGPGSELNSVARLDFGRPDPLNEIVSSLQMQYFDGLSHLNTQPVPSRYAAFADAHSDSLENPAYATEFSRSEGRFYWLPSFSRARELVRVADSVHVDSVHPLDHTISSHVSFFMPVLNSRFVIGGAASMTRTELQGMKAASYLLSPSPDLYVERDSAEMATKTFSLLLARRFGSRGRTSVGVKFDYLSGRGAASVEDAKTRYGFTDVFRLEMRAVIDRARLTAGLAREFGGGKKLGLFFRAGNTPSVYSELQLSTDPESRGLAGIQLGEEHHSGRTAEWGVKWRSPLTRRLFYGLESLLSVERWDADYSVRNLENHRASSSSSAGQTTRGLVSGGIGYALGKKTFLDFDLTAGNYREHGRTRNPGRGVEAINLSRSHFLALHVGGQTDLWRGLFVSGSFMKTMKWESRYGGFTNPPGDGAKIIYPGVTRYFSNFGMGWRLRPNLFAQYQLSTNYGSTPFSHSLMFRYTFDFDGKR